MLGAPHAVYKTVNPTVERLEPKQLHPNSYEIRKWVSVHHFSPCYDPISAGYALGDPISRSNCPMSCQIFNLKKILCGGFTHERLKEDYITRPTDTHTFHADIVLALRPTLRLIGIAPEPRGAKISMAVINGIGHYCLSITKTFLNQFFPR